MGTLVQAMNDKLVTYADLDTLRRARVVLRDGTPQASLLDRLIAAVEDDAPPLPEGWVLRHCGSETYQALYHKGDGKLRMWKQGAPVGLIGDPGFTRDRLTPLRPTVTEADVEKAARAAHESEWTGAWTDLHEETRASYAKQVRAALDALGIEVTS